MERWFWGAFALVGVVGLVWMWRNTPDGLDAALYRRGFLGNYGALTWMAAVRSLTSERWWWLILPAIPLMVIGIVNTTRFARRSNEAALERWRAKGSPPALRDPGGRS